MSRTGMLLGFCLLAPAACAGSGVTGHARVEGPSTITHPRQDIVCFATGHGELPLEGEIDSVSSLAARLRHVGVVARTLDLSGTAVALGDCDALVIVGPHRAFSSGESQRVVRYMLDRGNAVLFVDPMFVDEQGVPTGLEPVAALGGIELTQSIVVEGDRTHWTPDQVPWIFLAAPYGNHPIWRGLHGGGASVAVFPARALRPLPGSSIIAQSLLRTTASAWGETETVNAIHDGSLTQDPADIAGPLNLAMAAQIRGESASDRAGARPSAGRLVVIGFSELAGNAAFDREHDLDAYLATAAIGWVLGRRELLGAPEQPASGGASSSGSVP